jgi:hypothetical protein
LEEWKVKYRKLASEVDYDKGEIGAKKSNRKVGG